MCLTKSKEKIAKEIIEVFETGKLANNYGTVTVLADGAGITYGKAQATDHKNTLDAIVFRYLDKRGQYADALKPYIDELARNDTVKVDPKNLPQWVKDLMSILQKAGSDPKMIEAQDEIFDEIYWLPAVNHAKAMELVYPLSYAVLYDTCIHSGESGINNIRKRFPEVPPVSGGDEKKWVEAYVKARRNWLANFSNPVVQRTVYRMDHFLKLIAANNWNLDSPVIILGVKVV